MYQFQVDRSDNVLPAGALQSFVRSLSRVPVPVTLNDVDDKFQGLQGLDSGDEWHGKEPPVAGALDPGNTLATENAEGNEHIANFDHADGFSGRYAQNRQEDIMIMQESNEESTILERVGGHVKASQSNFFFSPETKENDSMAHFDIARSDNDINDIKYEDRSSPVYGNELSIYDDIEESLERMNSPPYRTALSIYDVFEDSLERIVKDETNNPSEAPKRTNIGSDLKERKKTITSPESLQTLGQKVISKAALVQTIDGDLETENSDWQEILALPLVGTDPAERIVSNASTDTEPASLPDLDKAKDVINQPSEEPASESNATNEGSKIMILDSSFGANSLDNPNHASSDHEDESGSLHNVKSVSVDFTGDVAQVDCKLKNHKHLQSEALVFASESEPLFQWEDSLYGRNKIHADLDHPLEAFF